MVGGFHSLMEEFFLRHVIVPAVLVTGNIVIVLREKTWNH